MRKGRATTSERIPTINKADIPEKQPEERVILPLDLARRLGVSFSQVIIPREESLYAHETS